jgi:hypothetical protein
MVISLPNLESIRRFYRYEKKRAVKRFSAYNDEMLAQVLNQGYALIPSYWSREKCKLACDKIDALIEEPSIKLWTDEHHADNRIMGVDKLAPELDLIKDPILSNQLSRLYCVDSLSGFTMGARLSYEPGNKGSGQGWHRDMAVDYQFKAILYLSDVGQELGPFQYYRGSGNALSILNFERRHQISIDQSRFTDSDITHLDKKDFREICAPAGTLIIANTRGIHRGKPIEQGRRYALTSYQWPLAIPKHIEPYVNGL